MVVETACNAGNMGLTARASTLGGREKLQKVICEGNSGSRSRGQSQSQSLRRTSAATASDGGRQAKAKNSIFVAPQMLLSALWLVALFLIPFLFVLSTLPSAPLGGI